MSKCENCLCNPVCDHNKYGWENCNNYKDKSLFVELPCKVGDTIHWIDWENGVIKSNLLLEMNFDGEHLWFEVGAGTCLGDEEIFLDRAEAERKLREVGG